MSDILVITLPAVPDPRTGATHWWSISGDTIVTHGEDASWIDRLAPVAGLLPPTLVALAPAASARVAFARIADAAPRQAAGIARAQALSSALGEPGTVHAVSLVPAETGGRIATALVTNGLMLEWLGWLEGFGGDPDVIFPAALLLPLGSDWTWANIAGEAVAGRQDAVFPYEPALASALIGQADVAEVANETIDAALLAAVTDPPINLRSGLFAKRRRWFVDRARVRELLVILAFIPLISLLIAIVAIARLDANADALDADAAAKAAAALGKPVTIETAEAELDERAARTAGAGGLLATPLAALYQQMQAENSVRATAIAWRSEGTLSATLAAARVEEINRLLVALQRDGYTVTAVPRQGSDGRAIADLTIRARP